MGRVRKEEEGISGISDGARRVRGREGMRAPGHEGTIEGVQGNGRTVYAVRRAGQGGSIIYVCGGVAAGKEGVPAEQQRARWGAPPPYPPAGLPGSVRGPRTIRY